MSRSDFQNRHKGNWGQLTEVLGENKPRSRGRDRKHMDFPAVYRQLCHDLAVSEQRMYGLKLCERLNHMVVRGYRHLHRSESPGWRAVPRFLAIEFPQAFRRHWQLFLLMQLFFWVPFLAMMFSASINPTWIQSMLGAEGMAGMDTMYGHESATLRKGSGDDFMMFGFYIWNNIGIDFKCFAGGIFGGVGSLFYIFFNGLHLGAAAGYVNQYASMEKFYGFVIAHGAPELMGMFVAGMAGMKMGLALLRPGQLTRSSALKRSAQDGIKLLYGAGFLTFVAAFIEGFWSAGQYPFAIKMIVGTMSWVIMTLYLTLGGLSRYAPKPVGLIPPKPVGLSKQGGTDAS